MAKSGASRIPKEAIEIYAAVPGSGAQGEELPFKMALIGDYTAKEDDTPIEKRELHNINQKNFNDIMAKMDVSTSFSVADKISETKDAEIPVDLKFQNFADFRPESVAQQVPSINRLLDFRKQLGSLKTELQKNPDAIKEIEKIIKEIFPEKAGGEA